jgi:hypothetical protein
VVFNLILYEHLEVNDLVLVRLLLMGWFVFLIESNGNRRTGLRLY